MKLTNRILSLALILMMAMTLLPVSAQAAAEFEVKDGVLVSYNGKSANVVIPGTLGITAIGDRAFYVTHNASTLESVSIPEGVVSIGKDAFSDCIKLTSVQLPSTLRTIGDHAFGRCPILSINFPSGLEAIGQYAFFEGAKIANLSLPASVKTIGEQAFRGTALSGTLSLPGVTGIGYCAFADCEGITDIYMPVVEKLGGAAFIGTTVKTFAIPASLKMEAIEGRSLPNYEILIICEGVTEIGPDIRNTDLSSNIDNVRNVILPSTLKTIREDTFLGDFGAEAIALPNGLTTIEGWGVEGADIQKLRIPATIAQIDTRGFPNVEALAYENGFSGKIFFSNIEKSLYIPASYTDFDGLTTSFKYGSGGFTIYTPAGSATDEGIRKIIQEHEESPNTNRKFSGTLINVDSPPEDVFGPAYVKTSASDYPAAPTGTATPPTTPTTPTLTAKPTASTVLVNGKNVAFDAYNIGGNNYFKLRDLAYILSGTETQFDVGWDGANNAISLTSGKPYTAVGGEMEGKGSGDKTPTATTSKIYLDGKEVSFTAYTIEGNNYFKLRDVGEAFDFNVSWDGANNTIVIATNESYTAD